MVSIEKITSGNRESKQVVGAEIMVDNNIKLNGNAWGKLKNKKYYNRTVEMER